jgi:pSer/pThr/pTyr-binding forkhead associated (FHA) protein
MKAQPLLVMLSEPMRGELFQLEAQEYRIGRDGKMEICVPDATVSVHHCDLLANEQGTYTVIDDSSTNGTRINGALVTEQPLSKGDILQVGEVELMFDTRCGDAPTSPHQTNPGIDLTVDSAIGDTTNMNPFHTHTPRQVAAAAKVCYATALTVLAVIVLVLGFILARTMMG